MHSWPQSFDLYPLGALYPRYMIGRLSTSCDDGVRCFNYQFKFKSSSTSGEGVSGSGSLEFSDVELKPLIFRF